jgi:hypothetical protein
MTENARKTNTKTRQPAKKSRLSSSRVKKPSVKFTKAKPAKITKKTLQRKAKKKPPLKKSIKSPAKTKATKKITLAKRVQKNRTKKLNIWLGRRTSLTLTFQLSKKKASAKKPKQIKSKSNSKKDLSFEKNLFLSMALMVIGILGSVYATSQIFTSPLDGHETVSAQEALVAPVPSTPTKEFLAESKPTRLQISSIEVDAPLIDVSKNPDSTLEVPKDSKVAGWYSLGPTPGEKGPSIIAGHVLDNYGVGVFWRLHEIKKGQVIEVTRADGKVAKFKVDMVKQYPQNKFPTEKVYGNIDYAGLRLITCGGTFNHLKQRYSDNTVVFASFWKLKK